MEMYRVYFTKVVVDYKDVVADTPEDAVRIWEEKGCPGRDGETVDADLLYVKDEKGEKIFLD